MTKSAGPVEWSQQEGRSGAGEEFASSEVIQLLPRGTIDGGRRPTGKDWEDGQPLA